MHPLSSIRDRDVRLLAAVVSEGDHRSPCFGCSKACKGGDPTVLPCLLDDGAAWGSAHPSLECR